jgi:hypothetical protein
MGNMFARKRKEGRRRLVRNDLTEGLDVWQKQTSVGFSLGFKRLF